MLDSREWTGRKKTVDTRPAGRVSRTRSSGVGPLTSTSLAEAVRAATGEDSLAFFDAIAPIVHRDSIDFATAWFQSRYDRAGPGGTGAGGDGADYINCPLDRTQYAAFIEAVIPFALYEALRSDSGSLLYSGMAAAMSLRNLVHCVLSLALGFAGLAALYLHLGAQFIGFTQILVYVGAVSILAVFVIMMTQRPGRIGAEIGIDASAPRDEAFRTSAAYGEYCAKVSAALAPSYVGQAAL